MKLVMMWAFALILMGCEEGEVNIVTGNDTIIVFHSTEKTQCHDDGMTPDESTARLMAAGIDVLATYCGSGTGVGNFDVCGIPEGGIYAHEIRKANLADAEAINYLDIDSLADEDQGIGYELNQCDEI